MSVLSILQDKNRCRDCAAGGEYLRPLINQKKEAF